MEQMRFGRTCEKKPKKPAGRHLKYPGDPKERICISIRESFLEKRPKNMTITDFFEGCVASSMGMP